MYLPRPQIAQLYPHLLTRHSTLSAATGTVPPLLLLTALTVDALCATRILTSLLRRDFVPHKAVPVSGYGELAEVGEREIASLRQDRDGSGGTVICIGCGGAVDLAEMLGLEDGEQGQEEAQSTAHGVDVWVIDSHRAWNLENIFSGPSAGPGTSADDARRLGARQGKVLETYRPGSRGGVIVFDEGEIETELETELAAWHGLRDMPDVTEADLAMLNSSDEPEDDADEDAGPTLLPSSQDSRKRRRSDIDDLDGSEADDESDSESRPARRRRSNAGTPLPQSPSTIPTSAQPPSSPAGSTADVAPSSPSARPVGQRALRAQLLSMRRKYEGVLERYYDQGSWIGEPVSSMMYSLASELGREDNEGLWLAIVGVESVAMLSNGDDRATSGGRRSVGRLEQVKAVLRDEVRRLNPFSEADLRRYGAHGAEAESIVINARSATDNSIRLSPEPRFLLVRHWSLKDSMLHSSYLATRLHLWSEQGRKRLNKLLAKMGISLLEADKGYAHLDVEIKQTLTRRLAKFAEQYNLDGLVPASGTGGEGWGFVRSWGWRGTLSAIDVANIISAILEVGPTSDLTSSGELIFGQRDSGREQTYNQKRSAASLPSPPHSSDSGFEDGATPQHDAPDWTTQRFYAAYDALSSATSTPSPHNHPSGPHAHYVQGLPALLAQIPVAQTLARAILRTGSALIAKKMIRHLHSYRFGVVKEGPDVQTFSHPGALTKLGAWVAEALAVLAAEKGESKKAGNEALVLAALDESRSVFVVVGLGGGQGWAGKGARIKAEIKEREERRKRKAAEKAVKKAEKAREREERKRVRRDILAANGDLDSDAEEEDDTESEASESSSDEDSDSDDSVADEEAGRRKPQGRNRFGQVFQAVVEETGARVRIDSFEHSVVEVRKEDLSGFLEGLSGKSVIG